MGCLNSQAKKQERLSPLEYKFIWSKCLKTDTVVLHYPPKVTHPCFAQIDKDIDRTFPEHPFFQTDATKKTFQNVLKAYSLQFPKVGYTQGLNFVAGFLLITGLNEIEALKALIAAMTHPQLMLIGLYQDDFPLCRLYCDLFWAIARRICPQAYRILKAANLPDELWIFQWFITLFVYSLPVSYIKDLFNFIFVKRYFAAVRLAVAIVQSLEKYLTSSPLTEDTFLQCFELMKTEQFCKKYLPLDGIIRRAQKINKEIVVSSLKELQIDNWYKQYFLLEGPGWQKKHDRLIAEFDADREQFYSLDKTGRQSWITSSTPNILDSIEERMVQRYERRMYRSSVQNSGTFLSRLTMKRCNSMGLILKTR